MAVGEVFLNEELVEINRGRRTTRLRVANTGDRPIQVGSHFHFFEANRALRFDRPQALGMHLDIPAGAAVRFEPGDERDVDLVEFGGMQRVLGFNGLVNGGLTSPATRRRALADAETRGYIHAEQGLRASSSTDTGTSGGRKGDGR